jgi:hypothetical protein
MTRIAGNRSLTYPIAVDGSALTESYDYRYRFTSADALMARAGRHGAIAGRLNGRISSCGMSSP